MSKVDYLKHADAAMSIADLLARHADEFMRRYVAELDVVCDVLLQAGWPPSRMLQVKQSSFDPFDAETITIVLRPGIEFAAELPVFQVVWVWDRRAPSVHATWLVDPLPLPHASTIALANAEAAKAARE